MADTRPILYSFRRCPYAIRARMVLHYSNIDFEHREVVLKNKPLSMLSYSPKGTVPVLVLDGGVVIEESREIIDWSLSESDPDGWGKNLESTKNQELIEANDTSFKYYLDRYKYFERYPNNSQTFYREKAEEFLDTLNSLLKQHAYLSSSKFSVVDVAIFPFVRQFAFVDKAWFDQTEYSYLKQWLENILESDMFSAVMKKYKPWQDALTE
ncbi:MAG: glutathione S-transferase [Cellvibrionaceae bacterium]